MQLLSEKIRLSLSVWLKSHSLSIISILLLAYIFNKLGRVSIEKLVRKAVVRDHLFSTEEEKKREDTLIRVFHTTLYIIIIATAAMMILSEVGINIGPILAAAGIAGIAVGFGGQYLIRDIIAGFLIIFENQYRVGDVICAADKCGLVEDINLRITVLRDLDGTVHHIPNGEIKIASNLTKIYSRVNMNIGVAYESDLEKVIEVINKVGEELAQDPQWKDLIIKPPQFLRVDDFGESAIIIKILGETKPIKQWDVMGEFRKRLKIAFDKEGIIIPYPQRVVHHADKSF